MAGFRDQFESYYLPSTDATSTALHTGLVALDTNVLLSLYRFQAQAREELFSVLEQLGDQLWIPHQVALEFHQKRLSVIAEQERFFDKTREDLETIVKEYIKQFRTFVNRIALSGDSVQALVNKIEDTHKAIEVAVSNAGEANEIRLDIYNSDEILARLERLFRHRVGDPLT